MEASKAIERGTLVPGTVRGFRELCERMAIKAELFTLIKGPNGADALKRWEKASQLVNVSLKEFRLTAFGKPEKTAAAPAPALNPFAAVGRR